MDIINMALDLQDSLFISCLGKIYIDKYEQGVMCD